jgi:multimeric flavodoxin WrbA
MKVTAILGSPRKKGDCAHVIGMIEKSFNQKEPTQVDFVYLNEIGLGFCKSCLLCYTKGEQFCPHKEVTLMLLDKMLGSDVVIFSSPVYEQHVTALMKNFYDNFSFMFHRPRFFDKKAIIVSSTGGSGLKETLGYMKMCAIGWGFQVAGTVGVCGATLKTDDSYKAQVQNRIDHLVAGIFKNEETAPSLYQLAMFRAMQFKALHAAQKKTPEYVYWQERGWLDKGYYTDAKISFLKKMYSRMIEQVMKKMISNRVIVVKEN